MQAAERVILDSEPCDMRELARRIFLGGYRGAGNLSEARLLRNLASRFAKADKRPGFPFVRIDDGKFGKWALKPR